METSTVRASTAIEAASTTEAVATAEAVAAPEAVAAGKAVATAKAVAAAKPVAAPEAVATSEAVTSPEAVAVVEARASIKTGASNKAMEPRTGADENAAGEPARTVVAIRRAIVRVIAIVSVLAHGSRADVAGTDSNAYHDSLRVRVRRCNHTDADQSEKF